MNDLIIRLSAMVESGWSWLGAGLGVLLLAGATLIVAGLPTSRVPTLDDRLEPYLRDTPRPSTLLAAPPPARGPFGLLELLHPYIASAGGVVGSMLFGIAP